MFLSYTLVHFAPTHLCRFTVRVSITLALAAFLGSMSLPLVCCCQQTCDDIFVTGLNQSVVDLPATHRDAPNVIAIGRGKFHEASPLQCDKKCRNINLLCIDYAFQPRLSSRLTLGRFALPRNPYDYGGRDSHPSFCYSCQHSLFASLHQGSPRQLQRNTNALLPLNI